MKLFALEFKIKREKCVIKLWNFFTVRTVEVIYIYIYIYHGVRSGLKKITEDRSTGGA